MNQDRGIEVRCVKCGWEGWSAEAAHSRKPDDDDWKKCCPTCGEGPLRAVQVAKVESALHE